MNLALLQRKLIAAARGNPPADRVPFAFEKRITALLGRQPAPDPWALWSRALWRAAVPCVALAVLLGACLFFRLEATPASDEVSQEFAQTILAPVDQFDEIW